MKICGIEIKGSEAILCILKSDQGLMNITECRKTKFVVEDATTSEGIRAFQFAFAKLMQDYQVDTVVIRERPTKGKFAGGALGFKIEAAIQLVSDVKVELIKNTQVKEILKRNPLSVEFHALGLKKFQAAAFDTAYAYSLKRD